jgi:hypothetical protein
MKETALNTLKRRLLVDKEVFPEISLYIDGILDDINDELLEVEKKQIMTAVYDSMGTNTDPNMGRAEEYYNETYGKK